MATQARTYNVRLRRNHHLEQVCIILTQSQDAIDALNSLQTPFAVLEARRKAGIRPDEASIREMRAYLARIGYTVSPFLPHGINDRPSGPEGLIGLA